ncbi:MAG TPA: hypothetical protein VL357_01450 [Rariglobus sp.]|jgi:dienelactone hydrolase|nr:hypothetical protein [Rariglobus sp.]
MTLSRLFCFGLLTGLLVLIGHAADASPKISTYETEWRDPARNNRVVPVKIYYPADTTTPCPVILFSHGLGGSREGYSYLGEYWAAHGYVSVHLQHAGSDEAVWKDSPHPMQAMISAVSNPSNARNRPRDVSFVLDRLTACASDDSFPLHGRLDLAHVGLAGHSFGAYTTLATITPDHPAGGYDPRFKAAIAMSAPKPRLPDAYAGIRIPVFHMTGTEDVDPMGGASDPKDRRIPYDQARAAPACLLTFKGGDHMVFSGRLTKKRSTDAPFQALVCSGSLAFWDATLKGDAKAKQWLEGGAFAQALGALGTFEQKYPR